MPDDLARSIDWRAVAARQIHPLKLAIIEQAERRRTVSPVDLAAALAAKIGDVSYHVRQLEARGVLVLVRTEQRRGATKHFYRLDAELRAASMTYADCAPGAIPEPWLEIGR